MNTVNDFTNLCARLEQLVLLFGSGDPDPLSAAQKRQLNAWRDLLNSSKPIGNSRTQVHVRTAARSFGLKIHRTAGDETLFLCILKYAISSVPKINYPTFYADLKEWSKSMDFPESLRGLASSLWNKSDNRTGLRLEANTNHTVAMKTVQTGR
jgi:hypothetical protein